MTPATSHTKALVLIVSRITDKDNNALDLIQVPVCSASGYRDVSV